MRYLWVEDFGEDCEDQEDKQEKWEEYFGIGDNILINSLQEALEYLDIFENRTEFDAVLLDIRFPILSDASMIDENEIYERYFSDIITSKLFHTYADSDVMNDASSGILLFMALIFRYGYSWNNIAFVSANIDDEDLSAINSLKELITKVKYGEQLSVRETSLYKTRYRDLFSDNGIATSRLREINESLRIIQCENLSCDLEREICNNEIKKLSTIQEKINETVPEEKKEGLKYCSVRNQFERIGLKMPPAFEKPNDESLNICWLFKEWKETRCDAIAVTKRLVIDMCNLLMRNLHGNVETFLNMQKHYNDEDSTMTEESINQYLQDVIRCVADCPEIRTSENKRIYATNIVGTVSALWEKISKPKVYEGVISSYYRYSFYAVMRLTRNWMAHQGINGIDIQFAAFVFLVSVKGIFDVSRFNKNELDEYRLLEASLIKVFSYESIKLDCFDLDKKMGDNYDAICKRLREAIPSNYSGKMRVPETKNPFSLLSALGHEDSLVRDSVSTVEVYSAFCMCLYYGDEKCKPIEPENISEDSILDIMESVYMYQKI